MGGSNGSGTSQSPAAKPTASATCSMAAITTTPSATSICLSLFLTPSRSSASRPTPCKLNSDSIPVAPSNIVTKSGSNALHGDLFEFLRNYELNARTKGLITAGGAVSQPVRDSLKRNQFGGVVGGKIVRDKLLLLWRISADRAAQQPPAPTPPTFRPLSHRRETSAWRMLRHPPAAAKTRPSR